MTSAIAFFPLDLGNPIEVKYVHQRKEVHFDSFLAGGFTTMSVINPPERKHAKRTSVQRMTLTPKVRRKLNGLVLSGIFHLYMLYQSPCN